MFSQAGGAGWFCLSAGSQRVHAGLPARVVPHTVPESDLHTLALPRQGGLPSGSVLGALAARSHAPRRRPLLLSWPWGSHRRQLRRSALRSGSSEAAGYRGCGALPAGFPSAFQQRSPESANPRRTIGTPRGLCCPRSAPYHFHHPGYLLHGNILIRARQPFQQTVTPGSPASIRTAVLPAQVRGATFQILCNATPGVLHESKTLGPLGVFRKPMGVSFAH